MNPKYLRPGFDFALAHAIEEAGEFIAAAGKTQRWGRESVNPELPAHEQETNETWLRREAGDVQTAIDRLCTAMLSPTMCPDCRGCGNTGPDIVCGRCGGSGASPERIDYCGDVVADRCIVAANEAGPTLTLEQHDAIRNVLATLRASDPSRELVERHVELLIALGLAKKEIVDLCIDAATKLRDHGYDCDPPEKTYAPILDRIEAALAQGQSR